jgi:aminoglycoside phosphotransferase (APT) family kinase protein
MDTILREAQRLWPGAGTVTLKQSGQGQSHDIYLVTLSNSSQIIARVARQPDSLGLEKSAIEVLTHIKTSSSNCQIPKVHWHNLDQSREIPPIILEDFVPGRLLSIWNSSISKACQNAFLDSLAQFLLDLWSIEPLTRTTAQPLQNTYPEWLESEVDRGISRCLNRTANWGTASDYLVMRSMIPQIAHGLEFPSRNAIVHGDMNAHNFMVNENLELTGYVGPNYLRSLPTYTHELVLLIGIGRSRLLYQPWSNFHGSSLTCRAGTTME